MKKKIIAGALAFATAFSILTSTNVKYTNALTDLSSNNSSKYYSANNISTTTGWLKLADKWYYLNSNGVRQTGWSYINNAWYYFYNSGEMDGFTITTIGIT